jgi:hypothetical protein
MLSSAFGFTNFERPKFSRACLCIDDEISKDCREREGGAKIQLDDGDKGKRESDITHTVRIEENEKKNRARCQLIRSNLPYIFPSSERMIFRLPQGG